MNGSIYNGRSGLLSYQEALGVESNNVANVNTVGFKSDSVSFNDMMYQDGVGRGTTRNDPIKNFSQGSINPSDSGFDFAIDGEGFFTLQDPTQPDKIYYTRTGQFHSDIENYLTNSDGLRVMGMNPVVTGDVITSKFSKNITSTVVNTDTSTYSLNTYTSNYNQSANEIQSVLTNLSLIESVNNGTASQDEIELFNANPSLLENYNKYNTQINELSSMASGDNNKSVNAILSDIDEIITNYSNALKLFSVTPVDGVASSKAQSEISFGTDIDENSLTTVEVSINGIKIQQSFDTSVENTLNLLSDKINLMAGVSATMDTATGTMTISSLVSGQNMIVKNPKVNDQALNVTTIQEASGSGQSLVDALYADLQENLAKIGGESASNKSEIVDPLSGSTAVLGTIQLDLNELGMSTSLYEKIVNGDALTTAAYPTIESEDGNIYLRDGDARFLVGKLLPVTFTNVGDLNPEGNNIYSKGRNQAEPIYIENSATVMGKYLEHSNIDLSESLVNLMVWQKGFESNSKTITTSDELLKTALALKK